ncbi:hypothetical protein M501DRAFT_996673 [Patellaria atrata CBS 101060]|uniref:Uncharacterized protein n=1 Tax=Patellaria atrata CBS 101060 TaxID=1346257 RepID=A0A9P4S5G0_9PEZI|nr:hypothetical protein M501DRAFT_996673 [Patellaria atrata CBS 101060]
MTSKTIRILGGDGVGKKTLMGSLIYKCGLDMHVLEQLQGNQIQRYEEIVPFFRKNGIEEAFRTKSTRFVLTEDTTPDVAIWVIDAAASGESTKVALNTLRDELLRGVVKPVEKLVLVLNKMDAIEWSKDRFGTLRRGIQESLQTTNIGQETTHILPVSALRGANLLDPSDESPWLRTTVEGGEEDGVTLVRILDQ